MESQEQVTGWETLESLEQAHRHRVKYTRLNAGYKRKPVGNTGITETYRSWVQAEQTLGTQEVIRTTLRGTEKHRKICKETQWVRPLVCDRTEQTLSNPHASPLRQLPLCLVLEAAHRGKDSKLENGMGKRDISFINHRIRGS